MIHLKSLILIIVIIFAALCAIVISIAGFILFPITYLLRMIFERLYKQDKPVLLAHERSDYNWDQGYDYPA